MALGPIPAYRQNVLKQMVAILTALDLEPDPKFRGLCCLKADAEFITRVNDAINLQRCFAQDEAQLWPSGVAAASTAAAYRTPPAPAAVAAQRADFVRLVLALREQADALRARHQQLAEDIEVKDALAVIDDEYARTATRKAGRPKARFGPKFRIPQAFKDVDAMAAMIRTERIPLDAVAEGPRVVVVLNGKSVPGVALDLEAEPVVLPSRLAAELGVAPAAGAPLVPLARAGGRTLSARPATIASVRIGPFEVNDVACLIPAEETDEAFPVLGASVLGRFVTTLDPKAGILTLTRVSFRGMATIRDKMGH